jgi:hypothetical protein
MPNAICILSLPARTIQILLVHPSGASNPLINYLLICFEHISDITAAFRYQFTVRELDKP